MIVCHCILGGTKACLSCPNNINSLNPISENKEIIEEFDDKGNLIKRIIRHGNI